MFLLMYLFMENLLNLFMFTYNILPKAQGLPIPPPTTDVPYFITII